MTLVELVVVLALVGVMMTMAFSTMTDWSKDQRASTSARSVADAFSLARSEALRTGKFHIVAFDIEDLTGVDADIVIANDGKADQTDCLIESGEVVHRISLEVGVSFGTDPNLSDNNAAPDDSGASGNQDTGSSFTDESGGDASWVIFGPDGLPRRFDEGDATPPCEDITGVGVAGGAIYVTNHGRRDYAVVLSPLGTVRLHRWITGEDEWTQ